MLCISIDCKRLQQYMLYHTTWLISRVDPLKYVFESPHISLRVLKWQVLLSKFDIKYMTNKSVKGSAIADHLAENPLDEENPQRSKISGEEVLMVEEVEVERDG